MHIANLTPLPKLSDLPEREHTATVERLLAICHCQQAQWEAQAEQLALQGEQIQQLKDDIAILKGAKARPTIDPRPLTKDAQGDAGKGERKKKQRRGKPSRKKTEALAMHDERVMQPEGIPPGSVFQGDESYVVQELEFPLKNTK